MPFLQTKNFGRIPYEPAAALEFPQGLPGFEERRKFVALHFEDTDPLIFLQSAEDPDLCLLTMPVRSVDAGYRLRVESEDLDVIGVPAGTLTIGENVLCLAVLSLREDGPTANLLAPIVINPATRVSVQAVAAESSYSHQHKIVGVEEAVAC